MKRIERVNSLIRDLAGEFLLSQIKIKGTIISATRVEASSDLKYAKIFISVFPYNKEKQVLNMLKDALGEWQKYLAAKFKAKFLPQSQFLIDKGEKSARKVEKLLRSLA